MATISAGQLFQWAEKQALEAVFLKTQSPAIGTVYQALLTTAVSGALQNTATTMADASITEYNTSTAYARQAMAMAAATSASPSQIWNSAQLTYGPFSSPPGTANWAVACSAVSGTSANTIAAFLLGTPRTPATGDSLQAAAGTGSAGVGFIAQV
jgi:hypothetical protein